MTAALATRSSSTEPSIAIVADLDEDLARHHHDAFGWALACCRWDRSLAEDVLHSAYLRIIDGRARFRGQGEFRAFLFGVIRQTAREERRRHTIRSMLPLAALSLASTGAAVAPDCLAALTGDETSRRIIAALDTLSSRQRDVLLLVFYQDLTIAAAAQVLGVSIGTARIHYERGKAQLRRLLAEEGLNHA